jgi:hypothetical protein
MGKENFSADRLTNQAKSFNLKGGDIIMPTQPGNGGPEQNVPPQPEQQTHTPQDLLIGWNNYINDLAQSGWPVDLLGHAKQLAQERIAEGRMPPESQRREPLTDSQRDAARRMLAEQIKPEGMAARRNKELQELFAREDVQRELGEETPNFNSNALKDVMSYFSRIDISSEQGGELYLAAQLVANLNTRVHQTDSIEVSEQSRRLLFEMAYEKLIGRPDYGSEQAHYKIGGFQLQALMDEIDGLAVREFDQKLPGEHENFVNYLSELQHVRELAHELNRSLNVGEQYKEYMLKELRGEGLDFMQNDIAGVSTVIRMYEKASAARVSETHTQLIEGDIRQIDSEVQTAIEGLHERNALVKDGRALTDWERKRALRVGKIVFSGTQRMAMYTGIGDINMSLTPASLHTEYIVRALMPFKEISPRFFKDNPGSKALMDLVFEEVKRANEAKGTSYVGLFGASEEAMLQSACGAKDMESHGWRQQMMFLGNLNINDHETLLDYLEAQKGALGEKKPDGTDWGHGEKNKLFSDKVKTDVLGQRLYLSILARNSSFDSTLKREIWEKIALLKPSTLASLLPETLGENNGDVWKTLRSKLYIAEEERVEHDAREHDALTDDTDGLRMSREAEEKSFEEVVKIVRAGGDWTPEQWRKVLEYMGMEKLITEDPEKKGSVGLKDDEKRLLQELIKNGVANAEKLSTAQMPFTFIIDDAPKAAWKKTGHGQAGLAPEDLIRILTSDQQSYSEGWNALNGLFEFPTKEVVKSFATAVDKIGTVDGRTSAQDQIEPFITGWLKMAETHDWNLWVPGAMSVKQMLRKPTSFMEEYYRGEFISLDEEEKATILMALSQAKAIRDSLAPGDMVDRNGAAMTQLDRLRKETKSDRMSLMIANLRILIMIFGPVFGIEFVNAIMPKELQG